ncbi:unnamed protein product, partial [Allacma fusca]
MEVVAVTTSTQAEDHVPDVNRFSSWLKLVRAMAWELRFILNCRLKKRGEIRRSGELTGGEIIEAQVILWKSAQNNSFPEDMKLLNQNKPVSNQ